MFTRSARLSGAVAVSLLTGCAAAAPMVQPDAVTVNLPAELEEFYSQELTWSECGESFECADLSVPLSYDEPDGEKITIALKVHRAAGTPQRTLVVNPGGPGGSGLELVDNVTSTFGPDVVAAVDIVGFDPRGVGESTAVRCYSSAELEEFFAQEYEMTTDAGFDKFVADAKDYGQACAENTGALLGHVDTVSAAKDMDILRHALGQSVLDFFGYSYGTFLGAHYAELFPSTVGRMVFDGAVDPSLSQDEIVAGQIEGFEVAFRSYLKDCLAGPQCPFAGDVDDAMEQAVGLRDQLEDTPVETSDPERPATAFDLLNAVVIALYNTGSWPALTSAITQLKNGDGSQIKFLSDFAMEREADGTYPEDQGAYRAIDCLDYPSKEDREASRALAKAHAEASEFFGDALSYSEVFCAAWPVQSDAERDEITAPGTPPIMVIGTSRDPATPPQWAEALADQLESGVLISYDGDGHTAYGGTSECVNGAVDAFLLDGTVPEDGLEC